MKKFNSLIPALFANSVWGISLLLSVFLFLSTLIGSFYCNQLSTHKMSFQIDNIPFSLLAVLVLLILCFLLMKSNSKNQRRILMYFSIAITFIFGVLVLSLGKSAPATDDLAVYQIARAFAKNINSETNLSTSYLALYPHQIGLIAYEELLIRIFHLLPLKFPEPYQFLQFVNVCEASATIFFWSGIISTFWKSEDVNSIYPYLCIFNLPFIFYTSFVYGEIPSFFFLSLGIFLFCKWYNQNYQINAYPFFSIICIALSVAIRKNNLIPMIAFLIVLLFEMIKRKKAGLLICILACLFLCLSITPGIKKIYEVRFDYQFQKGIPSSSHIAMGMQESIIAEGWNNDFNLNTYIQSGYDTKTAHEKSIEAIKIRQQYFKENPGKAFTFYLRKIVSQWTDGTYSCLQFTRNTEGNRFSTFSDLYSEQKSTTRGAFIMFCNYVQLFVYLGFLLFNLNILFCKLHKEEHAISVLECFGLLSIIGGFLFHILWEAGSRYILLYVLFMIPFSAKGIFDTLKKIETSLKKDS